MINTLELVPLEERVDIIDKYATKLLNSEYHHLKNQQVCKNFGGKLSLNIFINDTIYCSFFINKESGQ